MSLTNDVSNTIACEKNRSGKLLFRVSGYIRADHGQTHAEPEALEVAQPQADQAAPFVAVGKPNEESRANDAYGICRDHGDAANIGISGTDEPASQKGQELDSSARDLEILRAEGVHIERLYHKRGELCQGGIWNLRANCHDEQNPGFGVSECLPHLIRLEMFVFDPLPIRRNSFRSNDFLRVGQKPRRRRQVWQQE